MRQLFLTLTFMLVAVTASAQKTIEIGVKNGETFKITTNAEKLKSNLEETLTTNGHKVRLRKFEIQRGIIENSGNKEFYMLVAQNESGLLKIATELKLVDGKFMATVLNDGSFLDTLTCDGDCAQCSPGRGNTNGNLHWTCGSCSGSKICERAITVSYN